MTKGQYVEILDREIAKCADLNNAPFGLDPKEGAIYLRAKRNALQWAIEMLPAALSSHKETNQ